MIRFAAILSVALLVVSGCSGPAASRSDDPEDSVQMDYDLRDTEDFDERPYADSPALAAVVTHDVPESLMSGSADHGVRTVRNVQGYRIQIHSSLDRNSALEVEEQVARWWRDLLVEDRPIDYRPTELPVQMKFVTPYYRVRIGGFETRSEAEAFLGFLDGRYPDAFLVLDTITVYR